MLRNYLTVAIRNLVKYRLYSLTNVIGMGIGMASCMLIVLFIQDELGYDRIFANSDRIYAVVRETRHLNGGISFSRETSGALAEAMIDELPEIEQVTKYWPLGGWVRRGERGRRASQFIVEPDFLTFFSYPLLQGDRESALLKPHSAVITPEIAKALSIDQEERLRRANVLAENEEFRGRLISAFLSTQKPWESSPHVEEQIYDAFLTREDEQFSSVFHDLSWVDRYDHLDQISDERIKELGQRLIHAEKPDSLPKDIKTILDQENAQRMITGVPGEESPWLTIPEAISETDKLILEGENENKLLLDYRAYLEDRLVQETSIASN